jgi:hypothetical protein
MLTAQARTVDQPDTRESVEDSHDLANDRRRFTLAAVAGIAVVLVPLVYSLFDLWTGSFNLLRSVSPANIYDLQAQAMLHGHLWVPKGSIGVEGFLHDGRTYTYFGLLPSLFRMPILFVLPHAAGHLTALSIMAAWILTALIAPLLIWRVRILIRSDSALGIGEATCLGALVATILGGSVLLFLAASPWVYDEDVAWAIPVTLATLFLFLGILDAPTKRRVTLLGLLLVAGVLGRQPAALACVAGTLIISAWFFLGRGGDHNKRWALPIAVAALAPIPLLLAVNWLKFGTPLNSLPLSDQVWTHVNAHRRVFLAASGGKGYSLHFIPTTLWAYMQPLGLRVQPTFPFFALPVHSPNVVGPYVFDVLYPTPSVPASMPLLFLLSCCALVVCFRRNPGRGVRLMRIPIVVAAGATAVDFVYGYIAPRYLGDFLPFLVLGGAVGLVAIWRTLESRRPHVRRLIVGVVLLLALLSVAINVGLALSPTTQWQPIQASNYVTAVKGVSDVTGHPIARQVKVAGSLPYWAPANEIYVVGDCAGVYLSTGQSVAYAPGLQIQHDSWDVIQQGDDIHHALSISFNGPMKRGVAIPVFSYGDVNVVVQPISNRLVLFGVQNPHAPNIPWPPVRTPVVAVSPNTTYKMDVWADPYLNRITVWLEHRGGKVMSRTEAYLPGLGSGKVIPSSTGSVGDLSAVSVKDGKVTPPNMSLCRALQREALGNKTS